MTRKGKKLLKEFEQAAVLMGSDTSTSEKEDVRRRDLRNKAHSALVEYIEELEAWMNQ